MVIGERLKALRESKAMSQGQIEKRAGLLRVYVSRVENGHTVPAIETLEKFARALEVPMYQLFYDGGEPSAPTVAKVRVDSAWGSSGRDANTLLRFRRLMSRMSRRDLRLLLASAQKMAQKKERAPRRTKD